MSRKHRETDTHIAVALPIVPMLDLSFQILFFAICLFNPSKAEGEMSLKISASGQAKAKDPANVDLNAPSDPDLDVPTETVVLIRYYVDKRSASYASANVTISFRDGNNKVDDIMIDDKNKTIRGLIYDRDPKYVLTEEEAASLKKAREELNVVLTKLKDSLEAKLKAQQEKLKEAKEGDAKKPLDDNIKIEPNARCKNELLVLVMDRCKQAGYKVSFAPPPDLNQ